MAKKKFETGGYKVSKSKRTIDGKSMQVVEVE